MPAIRLCVVFLTLAASASCRSGPSGAKAPPDTLAVVTHLEGITAPCGCTSRPLGGIDRIAHAIDTQQWPLVLVGNTFMPERAPTAAMSGYVRTTAQIMARILARLTPTAVAVGPWDIGPMRDVLAGMPQEILQPLFGGAPPGARQDAPETHLLRRGRLLALGGLTLGIIEGPPLPPEQRAEAMGTSKANSTAHVTQDRGTRDQAQRAVAHSGHPFDPQALSDEAARLRQRGAQGIVLLWPHGTAQARAFVADVKGVDIVLAGSEEEPKAPEPLGSAVLLDGGARGEFVGLLTVHKGSDAGPLSLFDGGKAERADAEASVARFLAEAQALPDGPAKQARLQRAKSIELRIAGINTAPPTHSYVTWQLVPMDQHLPQAAWAKTALEGYNQALCDSAMADTAARTCPEPVGNNSRYVGTATCQACHQEAYAVWAKTAHSRAWATLASAGKTCDLSCVGCHVVGYEQPGGFCHLQDAAPFHNVGCESCHGPGLGHVQNPNAPQAWGQTFVRNTPEATCRGCHNSQHSDQFNFSTYLPRVLGPGHGQPSETAANP